jgi:hypothetical protein
MVELFNQRRVSSGGPVETVACGGPGIIGVAVDMGGGNDIVAGAGHDSWEHVPELYAGLGTGDDETEGSWVGLPLTRIDGDTSTSGSATTRS